MGYQYLLVGQPFVHFNIMAIGLVLTAGKEPVQLD